MISPAPTITTATTTTTTSTSAIQTEPPLETSTSTTIKTSSASLSPFLGVDLCPGTVKTIECPGEIINIKDAYYGVSNTSPINCVYK